ncbi:MULTISPECIES: hypothetical protein [Vibrio]|uniref:hypothetical protein n=1 Tax=Vibrio TaxID=662 RepID=UPI001E484617|nr:hypothetical protein [Vibrio alginolyticus]MCG6332269.1 hypothetical protein [Vibrio alginolyticus]MCG6336100.1 hypothetical protein [Vibrio alginolyticus]MCG6397195.1 hypothetical protein [Vibrio alginolyticus]MCR9531394.1 hypothetical protein [Vibrio alginolyticus]MCR9540509.1 hypothetical protein [Vibrio alginolyticus]
MKMFKRAILTGQPSEMMEETSAIHLRFSASAIPNEVFVRGSKSVYSSACTFGH